MAIFRLTTSPRNVNIAVEVSESPLQESIVSVLIGFRLLHADQEISEMNGRPFNECTAEDLLLNGVNILTVVQRVVQRRTFLFIFFYAHNCLYSLQNILSS